MKTILLIPLIFLTGCGTPQVWYQAGKTPAETYRDFGACKMDASKTVNGAIVGRPMGLMSRNIAIDDILTGCMFEKGYQPVCAKDIPDGKCYPER